MIVPVRQSTPTKALEIIYNVEPLHLKLLMLMAALRVEPKVTWYPINNSKIGHFQNSRNQLLEELKTVKQ